MANAWGDSFDGWQPGSWGAEAGDLTAPNVVGQTEGNASNAILSPGLVPSVSRTFSLTVALGIVIYQSPAAGTSIAAGSTIVIFVSKGPSTGGEHVQRLRTSRRAMRVY